MNEGREKASRPPHQGAVLARVYGDVRLEAQGGPFIAPQEILSLTRGGMLKLLQRSSVLVAQERGYTSTLPRFDLQYTCTDPGTFRLELRALDPRPGWLRLLAPVPQRYRSELRRMLRWVSEMLCVTVQLVPPVVLADDIRVSASADNDGFGTLILNNRRTYRVPVLMSKVFDGDPELAQAAGEMMSCLMIPELTSIVIVRDPLEPELRHEMVIPLTDEFHERVMSEDFHSLMAKVEYQESPLSPVLTRHERRQVFDTGISGLGKPK